MVQFEFYLAAILIVGVFTFLYKENPYFRFMEFTLLGTTVANGVVFAFDQVNTISIAAVMKGNWIKIIPIILGLIVFMRLLRGYEFASNWPIALVIGVGAALSIRGYNSAQVVGQIIASLSWAFAKNASISSLEEGFLTAVFSICALSVFVFTREHKGVLAWLSKIGRLMIMIGFGVNAVALGNTYLQGFVTIIEQLLATMGLMPM